MRGEEADSRGWASREVRAAAADLATVGAAAADLATVDAATAVQGRRGSAVQGRRGSAEESRAAFPA
jgi:hypothetical protein